MVWENTNTIVLIAICLQCSGNDRKSEVLGAKREKSDIVEERCYEGLGCVRLSSEWFDPIHRPVNFLPSDRHAVNTIFVSWTLDGANLISSVIGTNEFFNVHRGENQKLLIHDFTSSGYTGWIRHLARGFLLSLEAPHLSVVSVDWAAGAEPPFAQAVSNARLVALEAVQFLNQVKNKNKQLKTIHVIGHGLGAHIAGYIGKLIKLQKITALDPTGPYFAHMPPPVRLHKNDAEYIEVVHSHVQPYGQGYRDVMGHVDFYPNEGKPQPGCVDTYAKLTALKRNDLQLGQTLSACSHKRSLKYYIEALVRPSCEFIGIACPSFKDFLRGKCATCGKDLENCALLHPFSNNNRLKNITRNFGYYLVTASSAPFCGEILKVNLILQSIFPTEIYVKGYFGVIVPQPIGEVQFSLNENHFFSSLRTNEQHSFLVFRATPPHLELPISSVRVRWVHGLAGRVSKAPRVAGLAIEKVTLNYFDRNNRSQLFCGNPNPVDNFGVELKSCSEYFIGNPFYYTNIITDVTRHNTASKTWTNPDIIY